MNKKFNIHSKKKRVMVACCVLNEDKWGTNDMDFFFAFMTPFCRKNIHFIYIFIEIF